MMILLAQNPEKQDKLREELMEVVPSPEELNISHINKLHYLKAAMKESFR